MPDIHDRSVEETVQRFRRASSNPVEWSEPSAGSWQGIAAALNFGQPAESTAPAPAQSRAQSVLSRRTLFAGLGGLVVGAAVGAGAVSLAQRTETPTVPVRSAILTPLEKEDEKLGVAELRPLDSGYSLAVDVPEGAEHRGGYIEVWLINVDLTRMVSVGVFAAGSSAQFYVSEDLVDAGYLIVDLSNEEFDEEPRHSGDTIMRGELLT